MESRCKARVYGWERETLQRRGWKASLAKQRRRDTGSSEVAEEEEQMMCVDVIDDLQHIVFSRHTSEIALSTGTRG